MPNRIVSYEHWLPGNWLPANWLKADLRETVPGFLSLAAAPTFAIMALLTAVPGGGPMEALCGGSPLSGMAAMYLLMAVFHLAPWLKLIKSTPRT